MHRNVWLRAWGAVPQRQQMSSCDSHDMLAPMLEQLCHRVCEEVAREVKWQREEADRLWNVMLILHKEQTEARSLLEESLYKCRDQRAAMSDIRRELAPVITAEQSDVASITERVGALEEMVAKGVGWPGRWLSQFGSTVGPAHQKNELVATLCNDHLNAARKPCSQPLPDD